MGYKIHKRNRDRHKLIMRRLRKMRVFPGHLDFPEEYRLVRFMLFKSKYSGRRGVRFVRNRFHRFWRRQGHKMERAIMMDSELAFEKENPHAQKGAIWWLID